MPSISIIATLDTMASDPEYILRSLESQTSSNFELVCVHAGGTEVHGTGAAAPAVDAEASGAVEALGTVGALGAVEALADVAGTPAIDLAPLEARGVAVKAVECEGDAAEMRSRGLELAGGTHVMFVNGRTRLAPGAVEIFESAMTACKKDPVDVFTVHMQAFDSSSGKYLTKMFAGRRQGRMPFDPTGYPKSLFQRFGSNFAGMLIAREHLDGVLAGDTCGDGGNGADLHGDTHAGGSRGAAHASGPRGDERDSGLTHGGFSCFNSIDDEPVAMRALATARQICHSPWPAAAIVCDRSEFVHAMTMGQIDRRIDIAVGMEGFFSEGPGSAFSQSYLEWLAEFCLFGLDLQSEGMKARVIDSIGKKASPVAARMVEHGANTSGFWESARMLELCALDREALMRERIEAERELLEKLYSSRCETVAASRGMLAGCGGRGSNGGSSAGGRGNGNADGGDGKRKKFGLFRK